MASHKAKKHVRRHVHPLAVVALIAAIGSVGGFSWVMTHSVSQAGYCCLQIGEGACSKTETAFTCASYGGVLFDPSEVNCRRACSR